MNSQIEFDTNLLAKEWADYQICLLIRFLLVGFLVCSIDIESKSSLEAKQLCYFYHINRSKYTGYFCVSFKSQPYGFQ